MTVTQAIAATRMLLDEPKFEQFGSSSDLNSIFIDALRQAAAVVARRCWSRGEKEATLPEWVEETLTLDVSNSVATSDPWLFLESVKSNYKDTGSADRVFYHAYTQPAIYFQRLHRAVTETPGVITQEGHTSRLEYTVFDNRVYVTRNQAQAEANNQVSVSYIRVPTIPVLGADLLPLAAYTHGYIVDEAAGILYRKEHPGDDRPLLGRLADLEGLMMGKAQ